MKVVQRNAAVSPSPLARKFSATSLELFDSIDADNDGYLSRTETREALLDPSYTGDQAAAVATFTRIRGKAASLSRLSNDENGPERRGITRADLEQLPGSRLDGFVAEKFALARKAAEAFSPSLFTDANLGDGVSQGSLADCWLLAAAVSRARQQPKALLQSFETLADGRYRVSLPQQQIEEVDPPTAAEAAAFGSSGGSGH